MAADAPFPSLQIRDCETQPHLSPQPSGGVPTQEDPELKSILGYIAIPWIKTKTKSNKEWGKGGKRREGRRKEGEERREGWRGGEEREREREKEKESEKGPSLVVHNCYSTRGGGKTEFGYSALQPTATFDSKQNITTIHRAGTGGSFLTRAVASPAVALGSCPGNSTFLAELLATGGFWGGRWEPTGTILPQTALGKLSRS